MANALNRPAPGKEGATTNKHQHAKGHPTMPSVPQETKTTFTEITTVKTLQAKPELLNELQQIKQLAREVSKEEDEDEHGGSPGGEEDDDDDEDENIVQSLEQKVEKLKEKLKKGENAEDFKLVEEDMIEDLVMNLANEETKEGNKKKKKGGKEIDYSKLTPEEIKKIEKRKKKTKKQQEKKRNKWYQSRLNTCLYVKGLPNDITLEEVKEFFGKAGVFRVDPVTGEEKIKIYTDEQGKPKGDALISYFKEESIELAKELLHEREIKPGYMVTIEPATFEQKGEYVPRKQIKLDDVNKIKLQTIEQKLLSWDEGEKDEGLKIVVIQNMFSPEEALEDENFVSDLQQDIQLECEEKLGPVQRIEVFQNNPNGVVLIKFKTGAAAEACIQLMNGRWFGGRQLACFYWDGKTDYRRVRETEEEEKKRIESFGEWIESQKESKEASEPKETA